MDKRSELNLVGVHPDLIRVVRRAAELTKQPFIVIDGLRTIDEERANIAKGVSQTLNSRHLPNKDGVACAVDLMAIVAGSTPVKAEWNPTHYQPIAAAMLSAAHELNILVEWGGNWKTLKDWGHFQLPWAIYK